MTIQEQRTKDARERLLVDLPITERRLQLAGVSTAILEGGEGPPIVLLHGPGESAFWWMRVIPDLVRTLRVIVPDLPGHGASEVTDGALDADSVVAWLGELIEGMGGDWEPFLAYNLDRSRTPSVKVAMRKLMKEVGVPPIPSEHLERIRVPTILIWGRDDRAIRLGIAEDASARYGWPLRVIDDAGDDPKLEQPEAFLEALRGATDGDPNSKRTSSTS